MCGGFVRKGALWECDVCGLQVGRRPGIRTFLSQEIAAFCVQMNEQKRAGTLFFVRVRFDTAAHASAHVYEVMKVLHSSGASYANDGTEVVLQVKAMPSKEQREALEGFPGVKQVRIV